MGVTEINADDHAKWAPEVGQVSGAVGACAQVMWNCFGSSLRLCVIIT